MPRMTKIGGREYGPADDHAMRQRIAQLDAEHAGERFSDAQAAEWDQLNEAVDELDARRDRVRELAKNPGNHEAGAAFGAGDRDGDDGGRTTRVRDGAMRVIQRHVDQGSLSAEAADRVDGVLRGGDAGYGLDAAYVETHGSPEYERAFAKLLRYGDGAAMRMTPEEMTAVQQANRAEEMRTAMAEGTGSTGGFGIPIAIDPTINLSSSGVLNPIRALADVKTMSTRELRLVTSDGVVAQYQAEAAEAVDNSPTLAQPVLTAQRATSFVPFSFEVDQDWPSLANELAGLVADAKDVLEATKFLSGSGTNEPVGVLTVGTTGALTTSQRVQTAGAGAIAIGDVYALKQAVGVTRFMSNATWVFHPNRLDTVFRLTPSGSTTEPQIMDGRNGTLLGKLTAELSTMATATSTGTKWAVFGDWKQGYVIGERLGMQVSIVPHLFGSGSRYPTGQKGLYCYWRNDGRVKVLNALRYGEVL